MELENDPIIIDDNVNAQIGGGRFKFLVGFDTDGKAVPIIPQGTKYDTVKYPNEEYTVMKASGLSNCYCNTQTRTIWCNYGGVLHDTGKPC